MRRAPRSFFRKAVWATAIAVPLWAYFRSHPREPVPTLDDLALALRRAGFDAQVEKRTVSAGGLIGWVVTITLAAPIAAFFTSVGSEAGKDAYAAFRSWLRGQKRGTADSAVVILQGSDERELEMDLTVPEEAFEALVDIDWSQMPSGRIVWDQRIKRWQRKAGPGSTIT